MQLAEDDVLEAASLELLLVSKYFRADEATDVYFFVCRREGKNKAKGGQ